MTVCSYGDTGPRLLVLQEESNLNRRNLKARNCLFLYVILGANFFAVLHKTVQLHRYLTHMLECAARGVEPPSVVI